MVASSALLRERGFAEAKRLCYAGLDSPTLLREVAERLRRVVPFETYCAQSNDPLSGLLTYVGHDGVLGEKEVRLFLEHVYFEEELDAQRRLVQSRFPVALLSEVTGGKLERAMRCREITAPIGLGYEVFSVCSVGQAQWGGLDLMRERGRPDFDAREVALLRRIIPHLSTGLKATVLCKEATAEPGGRRTMVEGSRRPRRRLAGGRGPPGSGVDDLWRAAQGAKARERSGSERCAFRPGPDTLRPLAYVSRRTDRATSRPSGRDDGNHRTVEAPGTGVAASLRIWVERTRTGGRGPRCAGCFYQGDFSDPLHLRVHGPGSSFQRIRQGGSTRSPRPHKAPVLRQPLPRVARVTLRRASKFAPASAPIVLKRS